MNELNIMQGLIIELPISEAVDRYIVNSIKSTRYKPSDYLLKWLRDHRFIFMRYNDDLYQTLYSIHEEIWNLESSIRDTDIDLIKFGSFTKRIHDLNDYRHAIKQEIDKRWNSISFGERKYNE